MTFIGRENELKFLEACYASPRAQLVFLYGRRRVGKTELLVEFAKGKSHVFFSPPEAPRGEQLAAFSRRMFEAGAPAGLYVSSYGTWEKALSDIAALPMEGRKLVILDEFPYLAKSDPSLPSVLQNLWDHHLKDQNVMLVLCGSSMSFMEKELLAEKNPLYGRATGVLKLDPMDYRTAARFFPHYSATQQVEAFSALGGVPHYLAQFDPSSGVEENIKAHILRKGSPLYSEAEFLLHQELRETSVYNGIIMAVALGASSLNEIAQRTLVDSQRASVYLRNLMELGIVLREHPAGSPANVRSKGARGLYRLADEFFRFWYAFVFPNKSELEAFDVEGVYRNDVAPRMPSFAAYSFEHVCREWLRREHREGRLPFRCDAIGRWWDKGCEIDALGISKERGEKPRGADVLVAECKFSNAPVGVAAYRALVEKAGRLSPGGRCYYLFSKSGFTDELAALATADGALRLVGIEELYA